MSGEPPIHEGALHVRTATAGDLPAMSALVNRAYRVEAFFKAGDRTDQESLRALMARGAFLLLEVNGVLAGSVYVEIKGSRGYFGMLSIEPAFQKQGLGARLVRAAEQAARDAGCTEMELQVVNLRTELPAFYRRLGYAEEGTRAFPDPSELTQPCHCVVMVKPLD